MAIFCSVLDACISLYSMFSIEMEEKQRKRQTKCIFLRKEKLFNGILSIFCAKFILRNFSLFWMWFVLQFHLLCLCLRLHLCRSSLSYLFCYHQMLPHGYLPRHTYAFTVLPVLEHSAFVRTKRMEIKKSNKDNGVRNLGRAKRLSCNSCWYRTLIHLFIWLSFINGCYECR